MEEPEFIQFKELVQKHIEEKNISALKPLLVDAEEQDILELVEELHHSEQAVVFRLLPKDEAVFVFEQLDTSVQEELIHSLSETQACEIFEDMDPDDRVRLLDELPAVVAKKMLSSLS
ncbi:MAG: magnesium transporter, partial [Firmicutes bacterium]|nr:magnesium transporter [Bacillota bacterium]